MLDQDVKYLKFKTYLNSYCPHCHESFNTEKKGVKQIEFKAIYKKEEVDLILSPYLDVFDSVQEMDDVVLHVTGNYQRKKINPDAHRNVNFAGFLSNLEYKELINRVDALMVLTTRENTMQRGGSEAISVGNPLITSKTAMLQEYFTKGTVFVENHKESIIEGILAMKKDHARYKTEIEEFREERKASFSRKTEEFLELIKK